MFRKARIVHIGLLWGVAILIGCSGSPGPANGSYPAIGDAEWPYWPVSMRIHPLTRVVKDPGSGELEIEARVEFTDHDNVTSRCRGVISLDLSTRGAASPATLPRHWDVDLQPMELNATHFDVVTRTYLFRLKIGEQQLRRGELVARFRGVDGSDLSARFTLEMK